jgi:hypothetical protein
MSITAKAVNIPVPHDLVDLVRMAVPAGAIVTARNKDRWGCIISWKSHKDRIALRMILDRVGLTIRKRIEYIHLCNGTHSCCCDCDGCYKVSGFWVVKRKVAS